MKIANWNFPKGYSPGTPGSGQGFVLRCVGELLKKGNKREVTLAVCSKSAEHLPIGLIQLHHINREKGEAQLGLFIAEDDNLDLWEEAVSLFLKSAMPTHGVQKVFCAVANHESYFSELLGRLGIEWKKMEKRLQPIKPKKTSYIKRSWSKGH